MRLLAAGHSAAGRGAGDTARQPAGTTAAWRAAARRRDERATTRCPSGLDWDLFLGVAPKVEYHPIYHPFNWRGWVDWGQGALGDMGAHLIDFPMWALDLGLPTVIETESTPFNGATYPMRRRRTTSSRSAETCRR